ncbi:hypothetical protein DPMN_115651 [Dreissena polymorpha]|uniref:Uncharacterized protein n=1 Tax=Dreissena polymorpha TaxID=45954 RepID=A0A9D4KMU7_DREPO|nr:hypothetical protein DPMN_115651 [Dreissena polymorpha]
MIMTLMINDDSVDVAASVVVDYNDVISAASAVKDGDYICVAHNDNDDNDITDQEEAHKRLQVLTLDTIEDSEDVGIEFDMQDVPLTLTEFSNRDSKME